MEWMEAGGMRWGANFIRNYVAAFAAVLIFSSSSIAQDSLLLNAKKLKFCYPSGQVIFKFEQAPYFLLLNTGTGDCFFHGVVHSLFQSEEPYRVTGKLIQPGTLQLAFRDASKEFSLDYNYKPLNPGQSRAFFPKGTWIATTQISEESARFANFFAVWEGDYGELYLRENMATRQRITFEDSAQLRSSYFEAEPIRKLFGHAIIEKIAGLPTENFYTSKMECRAREAALKDALQTVKSWIVDIKAGGYEAFSVVLRAHSDDHYFYQSNTWWQAFLEVSFNAADKCKLQSISLYDSAVCPGPRTDNPFANNRDCFVRPRVGSDAESKLQRELKNVLAGQL